MSRQSFITRGPIPANMNGIELTEQRYAVDRFYHPDDGAASYLQDNIADWVGDFSGATLSGNVLTITSAVSPTTAGNYNIVNRTVVINGSTAALTSSGNGIHINLINCQIDVRQGTAAPNTAFGSWPNAGDGTARVAETFTDIANPTAAQLATARANSRSLNIYGGSINVSDTSGSRFFSPSDLFDSEIDFASDTATGPGALFGTTTNGRWVRFALRKVVDDQTARGAARTNAYGILRQLVAPVFDGYGIRQGNANYDTTLIVDEPDFPNERQESFYSMNVQNSDRDQPIQTIGGPSLGSLNEAWGNLNGQATPGLISQSDEDSQSLSGVLTTIADKRRFFSDAQLTNGAAGVFLRTRVNADPSLFNNAGDWNLRAQSTSPTTTNRDLIIDYQTNADGMWSSFRYSENGGSTYNNGFVDWFFWDTRTDVGTTNLATAWSNNSAPLGTVVIPAQYTYGTIAASTSGSKTFNEYSSETEIRSYNWTVTEAAEVYTLPAAAQPLRVNSGNNVVVADETIVAADVAAAELPFATSNAKSFQQLSDKIKRDWALFGLDRNRLVGGGEFSWIGSITITNTDADTNLSGNILTFNRVSGLDNSQAGHPVNGLNVTGALDIQVPFEGLLLFSTLNANDQGTGDVILQGTTVNNWSVTTAHTGTTVNGAITFNLTNASGTMTAEQIFGNNVIPGNAGNITVNADAAITIQVPDTTSTRLQAGTNVTLENIPAGAVTNSINVDTSVGGYIAVRQNVDGADTEVLFVGRFTAGSTIAGLDSFSSTVFDNDDTITVYIKYDSDIATRTYYQEFAQTFTFDTTMNAVHQVGLPQPVASALVGTPDGMGSGASTALPSNFRIDTSLYDTSTVGAMNTALVTISNSVDQAALDIGQQDGLAIAADVANTEGYFTSYYNNRASGVTPIAEFAQNATVNWDRSRITFASGDVEGGFRVQHVIRNWAGTGTGNFALSRTGAGEVSPQISGAASIGTVIQAIDGSNVGVQVGDMHNFLGNQALNPINTAPAGGFDRTDSTANYGQNIERS